MRCWEATALEKLERVVGKLLEGNCLYVGLSVEKTEVKLSSLDCSEYKEQE